METAYKQRGGSARGTESPDARLNPANADEADMVDMWVSIWISRKLFLIVTLAVFIALIFILETKYYSASSVAIRSLIAIETTPVDGEIQPIVPAASLVKRIQLAKLPYFSSRDRFSAISRLISGTSVDFIGNTNLVEIVSNATDALESDVKLFHQQLLDEVLSDLDKASAMDKSRIRNELYSVNARIVMLEGIKIELEHALASGNQEPVISELRKDNLELEIDILQQQAANLEDMSSAEGSEALVRASALKNTGKLGRLVAYTLAIILSLIVGIVGILIARFAARVKQRMVLEG